MASIHDENKRLGIGGGGSILDANRELGFEHGEAFEGGIGSDIMSGLNSAAEFIGDIPLPVVNSTEDINSELRLRLGMDDKTMFGEQLPPAKRVEGMRLRDLNPIDLIGQGVGDVGEMIGGFHKVLNPFAGENDEGGIIDTFMGIGESALNNPLETARAVGGAPLAAAESFMGIPGASARFKKEVTENPLTSVLDVIPGAAVGKNIAKADKASDLLKVTEGAGDVSRKIGEGVKATKEFVAGEDVVNRVADASVGKSSGIQDAARVIRERARAGDTSKHVDGFGSADLENVSTLTNKLKDTVFGAIPRKANDIYETNFKNLSLKSPDKPLDFNVPRRDMFTTLREKYGIDAKGFAEGETRLESFKDAASGIRDNEVAQKRIREVVAKIDGMVDRYKGKTLTTDKSRQGLSGQRKVKTGNEKTYTLEKIKNDLDGLRDTQYEKKLGVNMNEANKLVDEMIAGVRKEFGDKLDGFNDMQKHRQDVFVETDKIIEAFFGNNPKSLRDKWKVDGDIRITDTAKSRAEQLLAPKDTHVARRGVVDAYQDFIKKEFDIDLDMEKAVAQVRATGDGPKGIARIGVGGAGGGTLGFFALGGPTGIAALLGGMAMSSPSIVGSAWRALGMAQNKVDRIVDGMKRGRQALREKGLTAEVIDAMTIEEMIDRNLRDQGDLLATIGGNDGTNQ